MQTVLHTIVVHDAAADQELLWNPPGLPHCWHCRGTGARRSLSVLPGGQTWFLPVSDSLSTLTCVSVCLSLEDALACTKKSSPNLIVIAYAKSNTYYPVKALCRL